MTAGEWAEDFIFSAAVFGEEVRERYGTPVQKNKKILTNRGIKINIICFTKDEIVPPERHSDGSSGNCFLY